MLPSTGLGALSSVPDLLSRGQAGSTVPSKGLFVVVTELICSSCRFKITQIQLENTNFLYVRLTET